MNPAREGRGGYKGIYIRLPHLDQHASLDNWSVASNLQLQHLDKAPTHCCRKNIGGQETSHLTLLFSLCPNYLLVLLTDDDDDNDDNDVDE